MSSDLAIRVRGLSKCYHIYDKPQVRLKQSLWRGRKRFYREFWALRDVSFEVARGETVGIIGRNGSGKSTLLQLLCGTLAPTSGEIEIHGRVAALLELGAGFNPEFTGRENVYMNATLFGLTSSEIDARYDEIAAFADIGDFIDQPVKTYSSGMFVRLAFAVIAHVDADVLVIDEALAVGDVFFTQKCMRFLRRFRENGALLFVSHDIGAVTNLCQRALWLQNGECKKQGSAKDISEAYLEAFYLEQQGFQEPKEKIEKPKIQVKERQVDPRLELINRTNLRNDIQIFAFDEQAVSFGMQGASIEFVGLLNEAGKIIHYVVGGEWVSLVIDVRAHQVLSGPIVGFSLKDRLGQTLFGDNTYLSYKDAPLEVKDGEAFTARFDFYLPILPVGDYSVAIAVAEGSQEQHVQHVWMHEGLILKSLTSSVCTGLVGVPMLSVIMEKSA